MGNPPTIEELAARVSELEQALEDLSRGVKALSSLQVNGPATVTGELTARSIREGDKTLSETYQAKGEALVTTSAVVEGELAAASIKEGGKALVEKYQVKGDYQPKFPAGTELVRGVLPLSLAQDTPYIDVGQAWKPLTRTVYHIPAARPIPGARRVFRLVIRQGNGCVGQEGDKSEYRLFWTWQNKPDTHTYAGRKWWGSTDEGGWDMIDLDHVTNPNPSPNPPASGQSHYWRVEGLTSGCENRVYNVTLLILDVF